MSAPFNFRLKDVERLAQAVKQITGREVDRVVYNYRTGELSAIAKDGAKVEAEERLPAGQHGDRRLRNER